MVGPGIAKSADDDTNQISMSFINSTQFNLEQTPYNYENNVITCQKRT